MEIFFIKHIDNRKSLSYNTPVGDESIDYYTIKEVPLEIEEVMNMTVDKVFELINQNI